MFAHPVCLHGVRVKFIYVGHRVKVKVTGAKRLTQPSSILATETCVLAANTNLDPRTLKISSPIIVRL